MIKSFANKETEKLYLGKKTKLDSRIINRAIIKLDQLHSADSINDLRIPLSNRLEVLRGDRNGQHSIRVNQQWRICFIWNNGAEQVEIINYH
jgi:proteic killer suppression protein